jgi:hypothetical protein
MKGFSNMIKFCIHMFREFIQELQKGNNVVGIQFTATHNLFLTTPTIISTGV